MAWTNCGSLSILFASEMASELGVKVDISRYLFSLFDTTF
jgi:hypothetical protein